LTHEVRFIDHMISPWYPSSPTTLRRGRAKVPNSRQRRARRIRVPVWEHRGFPESTSATEVRRTTHAGAEFHSRTRLYRQGVAGQRPLSIQHSKKWGGADESGLQLRWPYSTKRASATNRTISALRKTNTAMAARSFTWPGPACLAGLVVSAEHFVLNLVGKAAEVNGQPVE
jgi:hypothetical protein